MLFFSTFCLFYRFTVLPVFFWGGRLLGLFGLSGLVCLVRFSFLLCLFLCLLVEPWILETYQLSKYCRHISCLKHGMQHIDTTQIWWFMMIQIWHKMKSKALDTTTWVDLSKQLLDSIGMTKHLELAPETKRHKNRIACASSKSFFFDSLKPPQQKHTPNQVRVPWRSLSTKCCGWRSRTLNENFPDTKNLHEFILGLFGGDERPVFLPKQHF